MDHVEAVGRLGVPHRVPADKPNPAEAHGPVARTRGTDRAEISDAAQALSRRSEIPNVRHDLIEVLRGEIAAGTYETEAKLQQAVDEMLLDL